MQKIGKKKADDRSKAFLERLEQERLELEIQKQLYEQEKEMEREMAREIAALKAEQIRALAEAHAEDGPPAF